MDCPSGVIEARSVRWQDRGESFHGHIQMAEDVFFDRSVACSS
jgi:hypothetical protein